MTSGVESDIRSPWYKQVSSRDAPMAFRKTTKEFYLDPGSSGVNMQVFFFLKVSGVVSGMWKHLSCMQPINVIKLFLFHFCERCLFQVARNTTLCEVKTFLWHSFQNWHISIRRIFYSFLFYTTFGMIDKCAICLLKEGLQKLFSVHMAEVAEVSVLMSGQRTVGMYCLHPFALFFSSRPSTWHTISHVFSAIFLPTFFPSLLVFLPFVIPLPHPTLKSPSFAFSSLSFSFLLRPPRQWRNPWAVMVEGAVRACLWLTALCGTGCLAFVPLLRKMEGTQRGGAVWKRGAVRGHSCVEDLVTLGFKQRALQSEESLWPNVRTKSAPIVSWYLLNRRHFV